MIGLLAARAHPERFRCLICLSTSPCYLNDDAYIGGFTQDDLDTIYRAMAVDYGGWVLGFAPLVMGNAERPALAMAFGRTLSALVPAVAQSVARVIFQSDYRAMLPDVRTPTLVVQAHEDVAVPVAVGQYLAQTLQHATLWIIEARGHLPHLSAPAAVNAAIRSYLAVLDVD
jgi:sigma-B regulation protein RsbQ